MIKLRFSNYKASRAIFAVSKFLLFTLARRGIVFDKVQGYDYKGREIDTYYLIQLK